MGFHLPHCSFHLLVPRACWQGLIKKNKKKMKKIKHARPTPKCELILARILKHGVQTNTMLAHAPASPPPPPQLPFVYLYIGRCAASAGDRGPGWRPFPARVFLRRSWIRGRHRPWITRKKQPWRNPKKEKNSLSCASVDWHSLTQCLFLEDLSASASFSPGPRFFFFVLSFCRVIFF